MKLGITYRLFLAILGATGLAVLALFLIVGWSVDRGFYRYLAKMDQDRLEQIAEEIGKRYQEHKDWDFLKNEPPLYRFEGLMRPQEKDAATAPEPMGTKGRSLFTPAPQPPETRRATGPLVIFNAEKKAVWGDLPKKEEMTYRPIAVNGETIGYIGLLSPRHFLHPMQIEFLSRQRFVLALAAAGMVIAVILISFPLARRLVKPLRAMAEATHDIAAGRYATRISVTSSDELGQLARAFNDMALTLEKNEKERRQWVADISHELRTPVSILQGEIEALLDGVHTVTPDAIRSLHMETLRLKSLINDLYQLSLSDIGALAYRKENLPIIEMLNDLVETYRAEFRQKGITVRAGFPQEEIVTVFADRERLRQLFTNLFANSLSYTDAGGELQITAGVASGNCVIEFQDSAPGVPEDVLPKLFERFYRVEASRNRQSGGAGLGLAICRNIVESHEGTILARPSPLGGLWIAITLPICEGLS